MNKRVLPLLLISLLIMLAGCGIPQKKIADQQVTLNILAAGTLKAPFKQINEAFQKKYPNVTVQPQFGGSVKMVKQVTEANQPADLVAVADYSVIPKYLFGNNGQQKYSDWYVGFAGNAITFVYTDKSKGQEKITPDNWYQILARNGVKIGRSNPDTDPSGYQTLQMLTLAERYYKTSGLAQKILANAPETNIRDTETELLSALTEGQIDYLAIYKSDAVNNSLKYVQLPAQIDLSDPKYAGTYAEAKVMTKNGELTAKPIIYALTILNNAPNAEWAGKYAAFVLGPEGQAILQQNGFGILPQPYANELDKVPADLRSLVAAWPAE